MAAKARIGITKSFYDKSGKSIFPGLETIFEPLPNTEHEVMAEFLPEVTPQQIKGFDFVVTRAVPKWTKVSVAGNTQLLSLHRSGVGYDGIDVPGLSDANVLVFITPDAVRRTVAVGIVTFILALSNRLLNKDKLTREGRWEERSKYYGTGLVGKTLGSIGVGNIGHEVFMLAKPFGMKHIACDPYISQEAVDDVGVKLVDMDTVLTQSDFLSISVPLSAKTHHLVGEKELRKMKKTAFLINTARGPIVDEAALIRALKERWIEGAGIDVFDQEPTPPDNPLLRLDNVIVTPHAIGLTEEFFAATFREIGTQIASIIKGELPRGAVNRQVWDKPEFQTKLKEFLARR